MPQEQRKNKELHLYTKGNNNVSDNTININKFHYSIIIIISDKINVWKTRRNKTKKRTTLKITKQKDDTHKNTHGK